MICPHCQTENADTALLCVSCGATFEPTAEPVATVSNLVLEEPLEMESILDTPVTEPTMAQDTQVTEQPQPVYDPQAQNAQYPYPPQPDYTQQGYGQPGFPPPGYTQVQVNNYPPEYYPPTGYPSPKSRLMAMLLCLFLGTLGGHYFYAGRIGMGILYLCTGGLFCIGWIVDIFRIATSRFKDADGLLLTQD